MAWTQIICYQLCQRLWKLPKIQDQSTPFKATTPRNFCTTIQLTIHSNCYGSYHWLTQVKGIWFYFVHGKLQSNKGNNINTNDKRSYLERNCNSSNGQSLLKIWYSQQGHLWLRPSIYCQVNKSLLIETRNQTGYIHCFSPSNQWHYRKIQPRNWTLSCHLLCWQPWNMGWQAIYDWIFTQL